MMKVDEDRQGESEDDDCDVETNECESSFGIVSIRSIGSYSDGHLLDRISCVGLLRTPSSPAHVIERRSNQDDNESSGELPGMNDDSSLVQHRAPHSELLRLRKLVVEWTGGLLDGDEGAETVGVIPGVDLDNDAVSAEKAGVKESDS